MDRALQIQINGSCSCSLLMVMFSMRWLLLGANATRALLALIHDRQGDTFHEIHWNMSTEQWSRSTWHTSFQCHQIHIISTLPQPAACVCTLWRSVWAQPPTTTWIGIWDVRAQNKCVQMIGWCYERTGCFCFARQQRVIIPSFVHLMAAGWLYSLISLSLSPSFCLFGADAAVTDGWWRMERALRVRLTSQDTKPCNKRRSRPRLHNSILAMS